MHFSIKETLVFIKSVDKMKLYFYFFIIVIISGCCHLPLVDCGPKIVELNVSPADIKLKSMGKKIRINAWQYYSRVNNAPITLIISFKVLQKDSVLIDNANIYINDNTQQKPIPLEFFNKQLIENSTTEHFGFELSNCCKNHPIEVNLDSIPFVENNITNYKNTSIKIAK
jgi:hypothetical protein